MTRDEAPEPLIRGKAHQALETIWKDDRLNSEDAMNAALQVFARSAAAYLANQSPDQRQDCLKSLLTTAHANIQSYLLLA